MNTVIQVDQLWNAEPALPEENYTLRIARESAGLVIQVSAPYFGDPAPDSPPGPTWELWNFEVIELFLIGHGPNYLEIELGPHGHHLVLTLDDVRQPRETCLPIAYSAHIEGARWTGTARIHAAYLPTGPYRANVTAIHGQGDQRRYLSWVPLQGNAPDFHQPDRFAHLEMA